MVALPKPLHELLTEVVRRHTGRRVRDLQVEVAESVVVIRGRTSSFHVKQLAQHGVCELLPNTPVRNDIVVG